MTKSQAKKLKEITAKIVKEYKPEKIILFGSWAWGNPRKWSDVDLFIIKETDKKKWEREYELRLKLFPPGLALDLLIYTPKEIIRRLEIEDFFVEDIIKKGKVLYEYSK